MCDEYDLLEKHIKFTHNIDELYDVTCKLDDNIYFRFWAHNKSCVFFKGSIFAINKFIDEILTNYPEFYKYDYSQIKPDCK